MFSLNKNFGLIVFMLCTYVTLSAAEPAPKSQKNVTKTKLLQPLLREKFPIIDRPAKLVKLPQDTRWFLVFETFTDTENAAQKSADKEVTKDSDATVEDVTFVPVKPDAPEPAVKKHISEQDRYTWPMEVLPGKWLTAMTKITNGNVDLSLTFRVWGEVTTYHNRNYILLNLLAIESLFGRDSSALDKNKKNSAERALQKSLGGANEVNKNDIVVENVDDGEKSQISEKLRKKLMAIPRKHVLELQGDVEEQKKKEKTDNDREKDVSIEGDKRIRWKDGSMIVDRVGRVLFESQNQSFIFAFEADSSKRAEPPVTLLPNLLLEEIEKTVRKDNRYRITGQISKYQGRYYMLLRKALIKYDRGNLEK